MTIASASSPIAISATSGVFPSSLPDPLFSPRETSELTGLSEPTLQRQRSTGGGIPYVQLGPRRVAYRMSDIQRWLAGRVVTSTSDARERGLSAA